MNAGFSGLCLFWAAGHVLLASVRILVISVSYIAVGIIVLHGTETPDSTRDPEDGRRRENTLSWSRKFRSKERKYLELDELGYYQSMPLENQSFGSEEEVFVLFFIIF